MKVVKSVCYMCHRLCGIDVHVEGQRIVRVTPMKEHQFNMLCEKAYAIPELVHSPDRLTAPLKKVNGTFKEISWDEALDFMAERLIAIKDRYGAKSVLVHSGVAYPRSYVEYVARRFWDLYGTPNYTTGSSLCYLARTIAYRLTCGSFAIPDYLVGEPKCLVVWGNNPAEANVPIQGHNVEDMVKKGARLIVIDPRKTAVARKADIHAQVRPGTDGALALGMLNIIISEGLYDKEFVEQWTVGFDKLAEYAKEFTPQRVEDITWVPAQTVVDMARMYASNRPAAITMYVAIDHGTNGVQALRAIATLMAITGNLDVPGGNIFATAERLSRMMTNLRFPEKVDMNEGVGAAYPLFTQIVGENQAMPAIEQMISEKPYPIKGLVITGCNPVLTWPNTNKFKRGREKLDFMVVVDIFMTDTAKMADLVLPGTTFMERPELKDYLGQGVTLATLSNKAVEPVGNCIEDWKIWAELGKRLGYAEHFPWQDAEEILRYLLKPAPISFDQLKQSSAGINYAAQEFKKYLKNGFTTPSKKVEIYSQTLKDYGYDPLPTFHEPVESPITSPDLAASYPLLFLSGIKTRIYFHSQYRNLPSLRKLVPEPLLSIHPQTAQDLGIKNGDMVKVESARGGIRVKAKVTDEVHPKIVAMQQGWSEANANYLTNDMNLDPISGFPGLRSIMCRVTRTT